MNYPKNYKALVLEVYHHQLERWSDSSKYTSKCPSCPEGILLVQRDRSTLELLEYDVCIACGQVVYYLDIETLREEDKIPTL